METSGPAHDRGWNRTLRGTGDVVETRQDGVSSMTDHSVMSAAESTVADYLYEIFGRRLTTGVIDEFACEAVNDLRRSVYSEAVPEMASRLAQERMNRQLARLGSAFH